jgi:hypothetical protein
LCYYVAVVWVDRFRKRNAQRINQWKAKRNEAVCDTKVNAQAQTENSNSLIDETTQIDQQQRYFFFGAWLVTSPIFATVSQP